MTPNHVAVLDVVEHERGSYQLHCVGLNWGGPAQFTVTLTTNGVKQAPITYSGTDDWCNSVITIWV